MRPTLPLFGLCALTLLGGCGETPAQLVFDRTDLQLGTTNDSTGANAVLTVTNHGQSTTSPMLTQLIGDKEITIAADGCNGKQLASGQRCTVTVNVRSDVAGSFSATLSVAHTGGIYSFPVSGSVSDAKLELAPQSDHLDVAIGQADTMLVSVRNLGGARSGPIHLDLDNGAFINDQCEGHTVPGGGACFVTLSYNGAPSSGTRRTTIVATGTPGGQTSKVIALDTIPLQVEQVTGVLLAAPDVLERSINVHNASPDPVLWNNLQLEMADSLADGTCLVVHDPCTSTTLPANGTCSVTVRCLAAPARWQDGALNLRSPEGVIVGKGKIHVYGAQSRVTVSYAGTGHGTVQVFDASLAQATSGASLTVGSQSVTGSYILYSSAQPDSFVASWAGCAPAPDNPSFCYVTIDNNLDAHVTAVFNLR